MTTARESKTIKIKFDQLQNHFQDLFGHITRDDIFFLRIERLNDGVALRLLPNNKEPWCYVYPYKYVLQIYEEFDNLGIDEQMMMLAHHLFAIPKNYRTFLVLREPDIVLYKDEERITQWLIDHQFRSS